MINSGSSKNNYTSSCKDAGKQENIGFACKLSSPELLKRKATVIAGLKKQVIQKKELPDGFAYKFSGSDTTISELNSFIKDENECCGFLVFSISRTGDKKGVWLHITGPANTKDFIKTELDM